jgi:mRNA interferase RelE/StbE
MPLVYNIVFDDKVIKDLKKIDKLWQKRIVDKIKNTLAVNPYTGKKLIGDLSEFWRLRVGDYRVIYSINDKMVTVEVIKISHRKDVYSK